MAWEDRVHHDPDGVDVSAIFEDIRSENARKQYEAVVGLYWLADLRPSRLESFENDVISLLGELPDFCLGSAEGSGGSATRNWATEAVGAYAQSYPHIVSELFDRAENGGEQTRADARSALGHAVGGLQNSPNPSSGDGTTPMLAKRVHHHHPIITDWLHDEQQSTASTALALLSAIAPWYCETATEAIPVAVAHLNDDDMYTSAMVLLKSVAVCNEQRSAEIVEQLIEALLEPDSESPRRLAFTLKMLVEIAEQRPECRSQIEKLPQAITDHAHLGVQTKAEYLNSLLEGR